MKLLSIDSIEDVEKHSISFWEILSKYIDNEKLVWNMKRVVWELLQNISDHSWMNNCVIYNYSSWLKFPTTWILQISIVDTWKGIYNSLIKRYPEIKNSWEAIIKALIPQVSWWNILNKDDWYNPHKTYNQWIWLSTTKEVVERLWWSLFIWTRDYLYQYSEWKEKLEKFSNDHQWLGTFVVISVPTNNSQWVNIDLINKWLLWEESSIDKNINIDSMFL